VAVRFADVVTLARPASVSRCCHPHALPRNRTHVHPAVLKTQTDVHPAVPRTRVAGLIFALLSWAFVLALVSPASGQPAPGSTEAPADATTSTATTIPSSSGAPQQAKAGPGDILITQLYEGAISVITTGEVSKTVVSGLTTPTGIATLEDGSILVAENKANRISGIGGRFPDRLTKLAETSDPYALGTSPDGAVYVTQLFEGKVSQLDLNSSQLNPVAEGLSRPTAVVGREGDVYVAEAGANKVTRSPKTARRATTPRRSVRRTGSPSGPTARCTSAISSEIAS